MTSNPAIQVPVTGEKPADVFVEDADADLKQIAEPTLLRSKFADHSKKDILRTFWRLSLTGAGVSLGGLYAGFCLSAAGNIIANQGGRLPSFRSAMSRLTRTGFINQFGTVRSAQGVLALDALHVSLWSGMCASRSYSRPELTIRLRLRLPVLLPMHLALHRRQIRSTRLPVLLARLHAGRKYLLVPRTQSPG